MRDQLRPQRSNADPGAGHKLEVLGDPPVEDKAALRPRLVYPFQGIAELIKSLLVERRFSEPRLAPISRRYVRAAHAQFELVAVRHELQLASRHRRADHAGAHFAAEC